MLKNLKNRPTGSFKGNSLVVTVVISLILAIICSSVIMLAYLNRTQQFKDGLDDKLRANLESAINIVLADTLITTSPIVDRVDLFDEGKDSVIMKKELWGIFQVGTVAAFHGRFSKQNVFFYGPFTPPYMEGCLYVADHDRGIAVVGNAKLIGDGYLPPAGIKPAYIDQRGYNNDKLIYGKIKESARSLPLLKTQIMKRLDTLLFHQSISSAEIPDSASQNFSDTALNFYRKGTIVLSNCSFTGHILIKSDTAIEVDASAKLKDVVLVAPVIRFRKGTNAVVQAFAADSLIIEEGCGFEYPSAFVMIKRKEATLQNKMMIGSNCRIQGIILSACNDKDLYRSSVEIGSGTKIRGVIYTMGYLTLRADVEGVTMTDFFIYRSPAATYENYLVDIVLDRRQLPGHFLLPSVFDNSSAQEIVQWVK